MSNYKERTVLRQETRVVDFSELNDIMKRDMHQELVRDGYNREHPSTDPAPSNLGPNRVTYKKWMHTSA